MIFIEETKESSCSKRSNMRIVFVHVPNVFVVLLGAAKVLSRLILHFSWLLIRTCHPKSLVNKLHLLGISSADSLWLARLYKKWV